MTTYKSLFSILSFKNQIYVCFKKFPLVWRKKYFLLPEQRSLWNLVEPYLKENSTWNFQLKKRTLLQIYLPFKPLHLPDFSCTEIKLIARLYPQNGFVSEYTLPHKVWSPILEPTLAAHLRKKKGISLWKWNCTNIRLKIFEGLLLLAYNEVNEPNTPAS